MVKRQHLLFSLQRKRIRASWNKFNLYNALTWSKGLRKGTLYQQKWTAKAETRAYHGEKLTEAKFRNHFDGRLNAVAPLQSAAAREKSPATPFALQTYACLEKRLDTALFRSMFASSPRQAAQFIRYGKVKVNGVTIKHPGYLLKAGDVFSCDPERVLQAVGRQKPSIKESVECANRQIRRYNRYLKKCKRYPEYMFRARERFRNRHPWLVKKDRENAANKIAATNTAILAKMNQDINALTPSSVLKSILLNEPYFDKNGDLPKLSFGQDVHGKSLSVFQLVTGKRAILTPVKAETETVDAEGTETEVKPVAAETTEATAEKPAETTEAAETSSENSAESATSDVPPADEAKVDATVLSYFPPKTTDAEGKTIVRDKSDLPQHHADVKKLLLGIIQIRSEQIRKAAEKSQLDPNKPENYRPPYDPKWVERLPEEIPLIDAEAAEADPSAVLPLRLPWLGGGHYGLQEPEKPYFTPWAPRPFLSPFAILPHHIEVSFETCHAIYMRDPIARPGHSEVISPFSLDMHERAYMFYVTRRRKN